MPAAPMDVHYERRTAMRKSYIWMAVTADEYELPIAIADTAEELGEILGICRASVMTNSHRRESGKINGRRIVKVMRDD